MKILICGFRQYYRQKSNILEKIIKKIKIGKNIKKFIFKVEFNEKQFIDEILDFKPEVFFSFS